MKSAEAPVPVVPKLLRRQIPNTSRFPSTGNESVPIQLAQCRFPGLAISDALCQLYRHGFDPMIDVRSIRLQLGLTVALTVDLLPGLEKGF